MNEAPLLLIVEDDDALRDRLSRAFRTRGYEVATASTTAEAEAFLESDTPELVLLDLRLPGAGGLSLVTKFNRADPATRIVVLTGFGSIATAVEAIKRGATQYLTKPTDVDQILAAFDSAARGSGPSTTLGAGEPPAQPMSLDRVEWEHINRVLADSGGNISEAARVLRIHRRSLQRKLSKYPPP